MDPLTIAGIGMGLNFFGGLFGNRAQEDTNAANQRFAVQMYDKQRADALTDWNRQVIYNSPQMQMARLKQAGLNPNLVYGNGAVANAATPVRASSPITPQLKAPTALPEAIGNSMNVYQDLKTQQLQQIVLKRQADLLDTKNVVLLTDIGAKQVGIARSKFQFDLDKDLRQNTMEFAQEKLRQIRQNMDVQQQNLGLEYGKFDLKVSDLERKWILSAQTLKESAARIIRLQELNAKTDEERVNLVEFRNYIVAHANSEKVNTSLKTFEQSLNAQGIDRSSPWFVKLFSKWLTQAQQEYKDSSKTHQPALPQLFPNQ